MSIPKVIHYCWFGKDEMPKIGDIIEIKETPVFKDAITKTSYKIHNYELATVLGVQQDNLLVCGKKIGKREIKNYSTALLNRPWAVFEVQRGDSLLLQEIASGKFAILHNITQEKIYYHAMQKEM